MAIKLSRQLEEALVAYLIDQRDVQANPALDGVAVLAGHSTGTLNEDGTKPAEETDALIITGSRPRPWLEEGGNWEIQIQLRKESQADDVTMAKHDTLIAELEDLFSPENRGTVVAWLNGYDPAEFGVVGFEMADEGESEGRDRNCHVDSLPYVFEAYYETA